MARVRAKRSWPGPFNRMVDGALMTFEPGEWVDVTDQQLEQLAGDIGKALEQQGVTPVSHDRVKAGTPGKDNDPVDSEPTGGSAEPILDESEDPPPEEKHQRGRRRY